MTITTTTTTIIIKAQTYMLLKMKLYDQGGYVAKNGYNIRYTR